MARQASVINLDAIDSKRKREKGFIGRLLVTRYGGGKPIKKMDKYGHYMFCGSQGSGKTLSAIWYAEKLTKKYKRKGYSVKMYSNIGLGELLDKKMIFSTINAFDPAEREIRIVIIDEIQSYFPRGAVNKQTQELRDDLIAVFSQLRKRTTYILSTAQVYGRLDKSLREQCLYMINCRVSINNKLVNDFIWGDDIICDDLGRWAGDPKFIYKHGRPVSTYDTKKIIRE